MLNFTSDHNHKWSCCWPILIMGYIHECVSSTIGVYRWKLTFYLTKCTLSNLNNWCVICLLFTKGKFFSVKMNLMQGRVYEKNRNKAGMKSSLGCYSAMEHRRKERQERLRYMCIIRLLTVLCDQEDIFTRGKNFSVKIEAM